MATFDLDHIEHRMASPMVTYRENVEEDMPALVAALREADARAGRIRALAEQAESWESALDLRDRILAELGDEAP